MRLCSRCVLPETRPNLVLDAEGVCNACRTFELRAAIDWPARARAFAEVAAAARKRAAPDGYDCIVPVSGGKDSTWQVVTCLAHGLRVLAVTYAAPARTGIGRRNLDNLISLGVDHVDCRISPAVERRFMKEAFLRYGSSAIPMHMALFSMPLRFAVNHSIPLVVWGENSAFEYGGDEDERLGFRLDAAWLRKFGVTQGTGVRDWLDCFTEKDLAPYVMPTDEALDRKDILAVFLGYYFPWDPAETYRVAREHGFRAREEGPKTGCYDFADIDDDFISIHHYLKWFKFGFTRDFDNLSIEIRHGRLSRDEALATIARRGAPAPEADIAKFLDFTEMTRAEFDATCERFRNTWIWQHENGAWRIPGFPVPEFAWDMFS
jgi:N-acetyl sugar amidotransferase